MILGLCSQEEERLVRDLFRGYNKLIRPVQNMTQKVEVAFGLAFIQLINVVSWSNKEYILIEAHCGSTELLYLVRGIKMDETNLCTIPLSILVSWPTNSD